MADRGTQEPPDRVPGETNGHQDEEHLPERLLRDRIQRTVLIRRLAAISEGQLDGEDADDGVDHPTRDKPRTSQRFKRPAVREVLALRLGVVDWAR